MNRFQDMRGFIAFILFSFIISVSVAQAQRLIERSLVLNPLENPNIEIGQTEGVWFPQVGGWGSFGSYGLYGDGDHEWYQQLAAFFEIYRRGNRWSVAATSQIEFIADANNDINFSPRAIFWEEGLLYTRRQNGIFLQLGYYHRCKHDIDNLRFGEERTIVFGSAMASVILPLSISQANDARLSLRYDHYTITWEKRTPAAFEGFSPNWEDLVGSALVNLAWAANAGRSLKIHTGGYLMGTLLKEDLLFNGKIRVEAGAQTAAGDVRFGIHLERLGDSGIPAQPKDVTLIGLGIRIMTPGSVQ